MVFHYADMALLQMGLPEKWAQVQALRQPETVSLTLLLPHAPAPLQQVSYDP
jgi:hypothetical protein